MGLMDKARQLMKGRSGKIEGIIDSAVGSVGKYSETLKKQAEGLKARTRDLDEERTSAPSGGTPTATDESLRGDLVRPAPPVVAEAPVVRPAIPPQAPTS